jgi:hypothetical protein
MNMVKVKTAELEGAALDWAVGASLNGSKLVGELPGLEWGSSILGNIKRGAWSPSTEWSQGGPLIAEYRVSLEDIGIGWIATPRCCTSASGSMTPQENDSLLVAACRAIVAAKLGDVVEVPGELVE